MSRRPEFPLLTTEKVVITLPGNLMNLKDLPFHIAEPTTQMLKGTVELILSIQEPATREVFIQGMIRQLQIAQEKSKNYPHRTSQED